MVKRYLISIGKIPALPGDSGDVTITTVQCVMIDSIKDDGNEK